jgi:hypothetical protein
MQIYQAVQKLRVRDTQTRDGQIDAQTDRQTDRQTGRQTGDLISLLSFLKSKLIRIHFGK